MISSTEEDYIKSIFTISRNTKQNLVGTNQIAQKLNTSAASVTDMLRKLSTKKLVEYEKYKGVKLSQKGSTRAIKLLRKHRLWESFLVQKLGFGWDEVHSIAEQLEHIQSDLLIERLDEFLEFPKFDPHGDPIPDKQGIFTIRNQFNLHQLMKGDHASLVGVKKHDKEFLNHLDNLSIRLGSHFEILEQYEYDGSIKIKLNGTDELTLSKEIAGNLFLKKIK